MDVHHRRNPLNSHGIPELLQCATSPRAHSCSNWRLRVLEVQPPHAERALCCPEDEEEAQAAPHAWQAKAPLRLRRSVRCEQARGAVLVLQQSSLLSGNDCGPNITHEGLQAAPGNVALSSPGH